MANVTFPCGYTLASDGDTLRIYYGAADSSMALDPANAVYRDSVDQKLRNYERTLAGGECQRYRARTGEREMHYQLCEVSPL